MEPEVNLLLAHPTDSFPDFGSHSSRPSNRGSKLQKRVPDTLCNTNDRVCLNFNVDEAAYSAVQLKRKAYELVAGYADDDDEEYLDGPYAEVNVEDILTFPASTNHICHHAPTVSTLRSRRIKMMAIDLMAVIERDARLLQSVNAVQDILNNEDRIVREMGISIEKDAVQVLGEVKGKEFIRSAREIIMETSSCLDGVLERLTGSRDKLLEAYAIKKDLAKDFAPFSATAPSLPIHGRR